MNEILELVANVGIKKLIKKSQKLNWYGRKKGKELDKYTKVTEMYW